jgi:hypothetical protein
MVGAAAKLRGSQLQARWTQHLILAAECQPILGLLLRSSEALIRRTPCQVGAASSDESLVPVVVAGARLRTLRSGKRVVEETILHVTDTAPVA